MAQRNGLQQFARGFLPATDPLTHYQKRLLHGKI